MPDPPRRHLLPDGEGLFVNRNSVGALADGQECIGKVLVHIGESILAVGIFGLGGHKLLPNGDGLPVGRSRFGSFAIGR